MQRQSWGNARARCTATFMSRSTILCVIQHALEGMAETRHKRHGTECLSVPRHSCREVRGIKKARTVKPGLKRVTWIVSFTPCCRTAHPDAPDPGRTSYSALQWIHPGSLISRSNFCLDSFTNQCFSPGNPGKLNSFFKLTQTVNPVVVLVFTYDFPIHELFGLNTSSPYCSGLTRLTPAG